MRSIAGLFVLLSCFSSLPSQAQQPDAPRLQIFAGYSFLLYDSKSIGFTGPSALNGWNGMAAFNLTRDFGVVGEASGSYGTHLNLRDVLVGPQFIHLRGKYTYFAHALFGKARSFDNVGSGDLDTQSAIAVGGGMDMDFHRHFAIRLVQVDYVHTHLFLENQNNLQVSTGLVYRWGAIKWKPRRPPSPMSP
jgi:hypothetical protein